MKLGVLMLLLALSVTGAAQTPAPRSGGEYSPKFAGDKAHSAAESSVLAYMRTLAAAQKVYYRRHNAYASSLADLAGTGSFTRRMAKTDRGDYTVAYKAKPQGYALTLIPRQFDPSRRSFFVDETGAFRAEADKPATPNSPPLK